MNEIKIAREAIVADLKKRYFAKDKTVKIQDPDTKHRWSEPQTNYFTGAGEMKCPVCKDGTLRYSRSAYNGHVTAACSNCECVRWIE